MADGSLGDALFVDIYSRVAKEILTKAEAALQKFYLEAAEAAKKTIVEKLGQAKDGDKFGDDLTVTRSTAADITLVFRKTIDSVFGGPPAFVRADVLLGRVVTFKGDMPVFDVKGVKAFMTDISMKSEGVYYLTLGLGYDDREPAYKVARGVLKLPRAGLNFDVFLGGISRDGIVVSIGVSQDPPKGDAVDPQKWLPISIPLGTTGLALVGLSGTFAKNFVPWISPPNPNPSRPTTQEYASWSRSMRKKLDAWVPVSSPIVMPAESRQKSSLGLGVGCDIVHMADQGRLVRFRDVGLYFLTPGNILFLQGDAVIFDADKAAFNGLAMLDIDRQAFLWNLSGGVSLPQDWEIIKLSGGVEAYFSLSDPSACYYNLGTDAAPIKGTLFRDLLEGSAFLMIDTRRVAAGGRVWLKRGFSWLGVSLNVVLGVGVSALVGWNPIQIFSTAFISAGINACIWKCVGISVDLGVTLSAPRPLNIIVTIEIVIPLPWPFDDVKIRPQVFALESPDPPQLESILRLKGQPILPEEKADNKELAWPELGAAHELSGRQWELATASSPPIWPDAVLSIPMSRRPLDTTGKVVAPDQIPVTLEQGYEVSHRLTNLQILEVLKNGQTRDVKDIRGVWAAGVGASGTPRLILPASNPFRWLSPHDQADSSSKDTADFAFEQDFGSGPDETGFDVERRFGLLGVRSEKAAVLRSYAGELGLTRVLHGRRLEVNFYDQHGQPQPVHEAMLVLVGEPNTVRTRVLGGLVATPPVKTSAVSVSTRTTLSAIRVNRPNGQSFVSMVLEDNNESNLRNSLLRVRVLIRRGSSTNNTGKVILQPGRYRLVVDVESTASRGGVVQKTRTPPTHFEREFDVAFPEQLRPYLRTTTIGDSRIFFPLRETWNPTAHGLGFPAYQGYLGVARFAVSYISKIFPSLELARSDLPTVVQIKPSPRADGQSELSQRDRDFISRTGGKVEPDEEIVMPSPMRDGRHHIELRFANPLTPALPPKKLDEWSFIGSRYKGFAEHIAFDSVRRGYGRNGIVTGSTIVVSSPLPAAQAKSIPSVRPAWLLPVELSKLLVPIDQASPLRFLRFANRSNCRFSEGQRSDLVTIPIVPDQTVLDALLDDFGRPYGLFLRTPEPLDWRRVKCTASFPAQADVYVSDVALLPSPDATSAFLIATSKEGGFRLPKGSLRLSFVFAQNIPGLPTLRRTGTSEDETVVIDFYQPFGSAWT